MSKSSKKFLKPTSVLIATLLASTLQTSAKANPALSTSVEVALKSANVASNQLPDPITLKSSSQQAVVAQHGSHGSHGSHVSHTSSHY